MPGMDIGPVLISLVVMAVALAIAAGGYAARLLLRAGAANSTGNGRDR